MLNDFTVLLVTNRRVLWICVRKENVFRMDFLYFVTFIVYRIQNILVNWLQLFTVFCIDTIGFVEWWINGLDRAVSLFKKEVIWAKFVDKVNIW